MNRDGHHHDILILSLLCVNILTIPSLLAAQTKTLPEKVPPKRTSQMEDGFGTKSDLSPRPLHSLEPLVVDANVRRRLQVDPYRPVREQFRLHQLGLDRAETRRLHGFAVA